MIQDMLPTEHRARFQCLSIPEGHLVGLDSIRFSMPRIVLAYGVKAKDKAGFWVGDGETKRGDIVLRPSADPIDLGHEVGHQILNSLVGEGDFDLVTNDWKKARAMDMELLANLGLTDYSLKDGEEFFADLYSVWAMGTPLYRKAKVLVRELFPSTVGILDRLWEVI